VTRGPDWRKAGLAINTRSLAIANILCDCCIILRSDQCQLNNVNALSVCHFGKVKSSSCSSVDNATAGCGYIHRVRKKGAT